jgi:hypothetical protein
MIEEYKALRAEIVESAKMMQQAISIGLLANGAIFGAIATLMSRSNLDSRIFLPIFLVMLPLVSYGAMNFWLTELRRFIRAGVYNGQLCRAINERLSEDGSTGNALNWELWLQSKPSPQIVLNYLFSVAVFVVLAAVSACFGWTLKDCSHEILGIRIAPLTTSDFWRIGSVVVTVVALGWIAFQGEAIRRLGSKRAAIHAMIVGPGGDEGPT